MMAHVTVMPAMPGTNEIHLEFEEERPDAVRVWRRCRHAASDPCATGQAGDEPRALVVEAANLSVAGDWQLRIEARRGEFDLFTETITVPIEEES